MSFFSDLTEKLFPKKGPSYPGEPFTREALKRNNDEKAEYRIWLESEEKEQVTSFILEQYMLSQVENENVSLFRVINSGNTNGFMLRYLENTSAEHFTHLFDFMKEQLRKLRYVAYTSDVRTFVKKNHVEKLERHYLKPSWRVLNTKENNDSGKMVQLYGNMTVELQYIDDAPQYIKFMSNAYSDSKFQDPLPFAELMDKVFGKESID